MPNFEEEPAVTSMPELDNLFELPYVEAFYRISSSRPINYGPGRIPTSEVLKYYEHFPLEDKESFLTIIQAADEAYVQAYYSDPKNKPKGN